MGSWPTIDSGDLSPGSAGGLSVVRVVWLLCIYFENLQAGFTEARSHWSAI
jgi:hypothetical protein